MAPLALLAIIIASVHAYSRGAGTCCARTDELLRMSRPIDAEAQCPYLIAISAPSYKLGGLLNISIDGLKPIKGLLLYAEIHTGDEQRDGHVKPRRVGQFDLPAFRRGKGIAQHHFLPDCTGGGHTITHTNPLPKLTKDLIFQWSMPANATSDTIVFRAAVLVSHTEWYVLSSEPLRADDQLE